MGSRKESEFLEMAKSTLWFWLDFLVREKQIELKKTNKYTIITIPNWDNFQTTNLYSKKGGASPNMLETKNDTFLAKSKDEKTLKDNGLGLKSDSNQYADGTQIGTNKKKKEEDKNGKEVSAISENRGLNSEEPLKAVPDPDVMTVAELRAYEAKNGSRYSTRKTEAPSADIIAVLDLFAPVNPAYLSLRVMMPQREAADRLLAQFGLEKLQRMTSVLSQVVGKQYAPVITTPTQLEKKMGDFIAFTQRKRDEIISKHNFIL